MQLWVQQEWDVAAVNDLLYRGNSGIERCVCRACLLVTKAIPFRLRDRESNHAAQPNIQ